jgi:hypothetical protein
VLTVRYELDLDQPQVQSSAHLLFKVKSEGRQLQPRVMLLCNFIVLASGEIGVPNESYHLYYIQLLFKSLFTYTGCPRRKGPNFGRVFLRTNYTDITQNTYIQS